MQAQRNAKYPELDDARWLHERYVERGMTMPEIAAELGCTHGTVLRALRRCDIPSRGRRGPEPVVAVGERYGSRVVIAEAAERSWGCRRYLCECDCGRTMVVSGPALKKTASCLACGNVTHGQAASRRHTSEYGSWCGLIQRCENPKNQTYKYYGGRGITVCARWRSSFEAFLADMGEKPSWADGGIDRIDPDGNYEPGNCRWATLEQQHANQRPPRKRH